MDIIMNKQLLIGLGVVKFGKMDMEEMEVEPSKMEKLSN